MRVERAYWASYTVLAVGFALRIALTIATPPQYAYDDHFKPIEIILREHRQPLPDECWECYQPPLYYAVAAAVSGAAERLGDGGSGAQKAGIVLRRKPVQWISTVAGCATLSLCLLILRIPKRRGPAVEAVSLACVAMLPQHVYMSAMVTNDALTYLVATIAVYLFLRTQARDWPIAGCLLTGAIAGLAVLCKAYSLMTAVAVIGATALGLLMTRANDKGKSSGQRRIGGPLLAVVAGCAMVGAWPTIRNLDRYGKPHVDNFDFFQTAMQAQFPGSRDQIDFASFQFISLLERPWVHMWHVRSFWTELYARYWFDYEGLTVSLAVSSEWRMFVKSRRFTPGRRSRQDWEQILNWSKGDVPASLRVSAMASYCAGLPIAAGFLSGLLLAVYRWRRAGFEPIHALHPVACLFVPVFQVLRLPFMSAMKAAFTLNAISSAPVLIASAIEATSARRRLLVLLVLGACSGVLLAANIAFVVYMAQRAG